MWMIVSLRTGGVFSLSTAGFAVVTAAILPQDDSAPKVARQLCELFRKRHGLVEICQKVAQGGFCHFVQEILCFNSLGSRYIST